MAMTQDDAKQQFEVYLSENHGITSENPLYASMLDKFLAGFDRTPEDKRNHYVDSMNVAEAFKLDRPAVDIFWTGLGKYMSEFISRDASEYGGGYKTICASFYNRERAANRDDVTFLDPHTIGSSENGVIRKANLNRDLTPQESKNKKYLLTGSASVLANDNSDLEKFLNCVGQEKLEKFERVIIPISAQAEPNPNNPQEKLPGHAFVLVWDTQTKKAMIVDQAGKDTCPQSKKKIEDILGTMGVNVSRNEKWLTGKNRCDCAAVASLIVEDALAGKTLADFDKKELYGNNNDFSKIDARHEEDQKLVLQAMFRVYENSPIFKIYCEAKGIDWNNINDDEKKRAIDGFKLFKDAGDFSLGDHTQESPNNDFIAVIKPYVEEVLANHPNRQFTQYQDAEHPNALAYKHEDGSKIIITSETSAHIESKTLEDHMIVCEYAKNMGCKNMDFGPYFRTHLDEAAMMYLAALRTGMGVKNAPDIEKFKDFPQYDEIKLRLKVQNELKDMQDKKSALANDENYKMQKEKMGAHVDDFKTFLNESSPQQQTWVDLTKANEDCKAARETLKTGLEAATPEEKTLLDKVRAEQHKNNADGKTESVAEIMNRLAGQGQQVDASLVSKVENLVTLHENVDASRSKIHAASEAFKAEIPNITAPGAKEYCEAWVAVQANPAYKAFREAEAGYKGRINAAFDEYLSNCTPEQRVDRIAALKDGLSGQKSTEAELTQLKENSYQPDGQKAQDKQKENIVQTIYARSYRGKTM